MCIAWPGWWWGEDKGRKEVREWPGLRKREAWEGAGSGGISPTQGVNPGLPHCRWFLYHLSHQAHPKILEWEAYPFSRGSSWPRNRTQVSCIAGRFFTSWATGEAHIDNKQRSTVWHMKLYSVFSNNLYGKRIWKRRLYMYSWITLLLYTWN